MKLCWDNLEGFRLTKNGNFRKNNLVYIEKLDCSYCKESYLSRKYQEESYCCKSCSKKGKKRIISKETKQKMSLAHKGFKHSNETKIKISNSNKGKSVSEESRLNMVLSAKNRLPVSENTRRLLSESGRNRVVSDATRLKISKSNTGKQVSATTRMRISKSLVGKKRSKYSTIAQSLRMLGNKNPNWRGGISNQNYCPVWKDKEYKESIKERDNYQCQNPYCFKANTVLNIHHIDYTKTLCGPDNLITVCSSCNSRANKDREWHTEWYRIILNKKYGYKYEGVS